MKTSMVDSQFNALEVPDVTEKDVITVDINCSINELVTKSYDAIVNYKK